MRQVVELSTDGARISVERGFLVVQGEGVSGRVPLDDVEAVIASAQRLTYSNAVLAALAERGVPLVICGRDYAPAAVVMPISTSSISRTGNTRRLSAFAGRAIVTGQKNPASAARFSSAYL